MSHRLRSFGSMRLRATDKLGPIISGITGSQLNARSGALRQVIPEKRPFSTASDVRPPLVSAMTVFIIYLIGLQIYYISVPTALASFLDEALAAAFLFLAVRGYLAHERLRYAFAIFLVYAGLTCIGNILFTYGGVPQPQAAWRDLILDLKPFLIEAGFCYLFLRSKNIKFEIEIMCAAIILLALANSIFAIYDLVSNGKNLLGHSLPFRNGFHQPVGFQAYQVRSAALTMLGASFAMYFGISRRSLIAQTIAIYLAIILFAHQSVKEIVTYFLILPFLFAGRTGRGAGTFVWLFGSVILAFVLTSTPIGSLIVGRVAFFATETGLDTARTLLLVRGFEIAQDHFPFGSGAGTFGSAPSFQLGYSEVYYLYGMDNIYGATPSDPDFLQDAFWGKVLGQSGFIGTTVYLLLIYVAFGGAFKLNRRLGSRLALPAVAVALLALITSVASSPFSDDFLGVVLAAFSAYALSMLPASRRGRANTKVRPAPA